MTNERIIKASVLHGIEFDCYFKYHTLLCKGIEPKTAKAELSEEIKNIEILRKYADRSPLSNVWFDVAMSTSKIGLSVYDSMNVEAIYPITDSIDDTAKTYHMYVTPYGHKAPSKKIVSWLIGYISKHYGYTCVNRENFNF